MRTPNYLLSLFLILPILTFGQTDFQNILFRNSVEFSVHTLLTPALHIKRFYPDTGNDLTSNNSLAFQAALIRHLPIRSNFSFQMGFIGGTHSVHTNVKLTEDFRYLGWGGFDDYSIEYDFPYLGINMGLNHILYARGKNILSLGVSINANYFLHSGFDFTVSASSKTRTNKKLFSTQFEIEKDDRIFILPQIKIAYHRKIGTHFSFKTSFFAAYSNKNIFSVPYLLYGDNENLIGIFSKKVKHIGISIGLFYFLKNKHN